VEIKLSLAQVKSGLVFKSPKNGKPRTVCIPPTLVSILREYQAAESKEKEALGAVYSDQGLVFARPDGAPMIPWNFGAAFVDMVERAGVPRIRLHDLRDTHASLLARAGNPDRGRLAAPSATRGSASPTIGISRLPGSGRCGRDDLRGSAAVGVGADVSQMFHGS